MLGPQTHTRAVGEPQAGVFGFEFLEAFDLTDLEAAELLSPTIVGDFTDADLSDGVGNAAALRKMHVDLAKLGDNLFWLVSLLWYVGPPVCSSHNIRMDHFKGGGSQDDLFRQINDELWR